MLRALWHLHDCKKFYFLINGFWQQSKKSEVHTLFQKFYSYFKCIKKYFLSQIYKYIVKSFTINAIYFYRYQLYEVFLVQ